MANLIRSAKSASDWSHSDLIAYNIVISLVDLNEFFPQGADPSLDHLDPAILAAREDRNVHLNKPTERYLTFLDLASPASQESFIEQFTAETLELLAFNDPNHSLVIPHYEIPLTICGDGNRVALTDVSLLEYPSLMILLVAVEDKAAYNKNDPEPPVVATAIAAFQYNNKTREASGLHRLDTMTIPCITMTGTRPTFYLVPVTKELSDAVMVGQYPPNQTTVLKCVTTRSALHPTQAEGMEDTEYRKLALQRFLAFKALARSHWEPFLSGY